MELRRPSATKYPWTLYHPTYHIGIKATRALTQMTKTMPPCLQSGYHRYRQLFLHSHLNCTIPPKMRYLHPPLHRCTSLSTPLSHPDSDTNLTSLPSKCIQPGQDVLLKRLTRTHRTPQYLEVFVLYWHPPSRPCPYKRREKKTRKETVAPLGNGCCRTWQVKRFFFLTFFRT